MADQDIFENIDELITEERALRARSTAELGLSSEERSRLGEVEVQLDQCWDLLRQRRALSEYGEDPSEARVRPAGEVEGYRS
ncbi:MULTISPECIES: DUF2630 family protein [Streptomyces]|uniref:DUF2630 family protein n=1 Tax=Streptomyces glycanivorans TaxID=3033808 RepID=A0ABY9JCM3_9ACTN|nr:MULTISPECIES: DUF2630 family protein [unclassified Streptomyces]WSQ78857.1 DUF2630 family protein [Streptomyces sp. NBC_01213]TXS17121.1 DUF2630 family protein [Streptomyces sp. wa22]WLQ65477.1 DUF2630 family protein [Streptomyces sp. Alt3]WSQ86226.1 DUF2630 family protein [Streptomyces sp. NBC_01212]WSR07692.1 DUF2630 family protein [Streptomyces sp. NBC_01208]